MRVKTKAAVCYEAGKNLEIETVDLEGPKFGEVLVEIKASGVCHTDEFTRSGGDPEGLFPVIFGHEGAGVVVDVGPGIISLKKGDHVIPLYTPECRACKSCLSGKTNLCTAIRATQGQGVMPDGTSRFSLKGKKIHHYMGCSTFSNYTVLPEIALAKIRARRAVRQGLLHRLRRHHRHRRGDQHRQGRAGRQCRGVRPGRHRAQRAAGRAHGRRQHDRGRRPQPGARGARPQVRHDPFRQSREARGQGSGGASGRADRRRRRLQLRMRRQHQADAPGAGMLPSRLGQIGDHRRGRLRPGDRHAALPARDRPALDGHGVRRRQGPARRAQDRRLVHGRQDRHRFADHPHACRSRRSTTPST